MKFVQKRWRLGLIGLIFGLLLGYSGLVPPIRQAEATDNQSKTKSYYYSERGFGIHIGSLIFDIPAFRDSSSTPLDSLLVQFGRHTVTDSSAVIDFTNLGMADYKTSTNPVLINLMVVNAIVADTIFTAFPTSISPTGIAYQLYYNTATTMGMVNRPGTVVHFGAIGERSQ